MRREAYKAFYGKLREYENVTAAAYQANVQGEKIIADQRGHKSVFDYLLFWQPVGGADHLLIVLSHHGEALHNIFLRLLDGHRGYVARVYRQLQVGIGHYVQGEKIIADQRGHKSVFDYLLFWQKVDRSLYDRQIDLLAQKPPVDLP